MELEKVIEQIMRSPFYAEIQKKEREKEIEERKSLAAELKQLDKEALSVAKAYWKNVEKIKSEIAKIKEDLKQKKMEMFKVEGEYYAVSHQFSCKKTDCQKALEDSADSRIDEAMQEFYARRSQLRRVGAQGNTANILALIRRVIEKLGLMKFEPVLDEKKLRELLSELPEIKDIKWKQAS